MATSKPAWWLTAEQKRHADAGCAHERTRQVSEHDVECIDCGWVSA